MDFGLIMYPGLLLLSIYIVTGDSAYHTVLIANNDGVHIVDPISNQNKTVLPFEKGANSVGYDLETGYVYTILKNNKKMQHSIVRTKVLETLGSHSCNQTELESWCKINKHCINICNSSNPYNPEKVLEPYECSRANNLVLDWINHNIYWTCDPIRSIASSLNMATTEGLEYKTVLTRTSPILSVDIDPYEGKLFFLESSTLSSTNLDGENEKTVYQFVSSIEEITTISLDTQRKAIYVIGHTVENKEEIFLAIVNYDGWGYKKHYTSMDSAWEFGPKIVNSIVYWLTLSSGAEWRSVGGSMAEGNIKMENISVPYTVNQWSLVHLEAQLPLDGSHCRTRGCSHGCNLLQWVKIACLCPSGMSLRADGRTCYENHVDAFEDTSKATLMLENSTSSSEIKDNSKQDNGDVKSSSSSEVNSSTRNVAAHEQNTKNHVDAFEDTSKATLMLENSTSSSEIKGNTKQDNGDVKSSSSSEVNDSTRNVSAHQQNTSEPEITRPVSEITTGGAVVEPAGNGSRDLVQSAVQASQNATKTPGVVTASSSNMTLFHIVFPIICISVFIVVVAVRKRSKMGYYEPAGPMGQEQIIPCEN